MNRSDSIAQLAAALAKAQGEMPNPSKNRTVRVATRTGPGYSFKFADLTECFDCARASLSKHGLSWVQPVKLKEGGFVSVETVLIHESGEWISETLDMPVIGDSDSGADAQDVGKGITFAKRYAFCALIGMSADDDDDGPPSPARRTSEAQDRPVASGASRVASRLGTPPVASSATGRPPVPPECEAPAAKAPAARGLTTDHSTSPSLPTGDVLGKILGEELQRELHDLGLDVDRLRDSLGKVTAYQGLFDSVDPADWDLSLKEPVARWLQKAREAKAAKPASPSAPALKAPLKPRVKPPEPPPEPGSDDLDNEPTF